ncbi:aspartyl-phosphate phosphatase Spo0E family protein [Clostridium oceanicum]|uniref:Spo0E like sporulation regulatory protein n=1 Tax=Clostridium oceanicum TaxID=1543 RepID=A0ABN1J917_9CLOT
MSEIKEIIKNIEHLRKHMDSLIKEGKDLLDPEVIVASQQLDAILNKYNKLLNEKLEK